VEFFAKNIILNAMVKQRQGFLLIEVVVALAVFALSATVIAQSFANGLVAKYQREASPDAGDRLLFLVDAVFKNVKKNKIPREELASGGVMHFPDHSCLEWKMRCEATEVQHLFRVALELRLPGGEKEEYRFYRQVDVATWHDEDQRRKAKEHFEQHKGLPPRTP